MRFSVSCNYCTRTLMTVASIGEREVRILMGHLVDFHSPIVKNAMQLGDLLMSFTIAQTTTALH